jgi:hypothetical protein
MQRPGQTAKRRRETRELRALSALLHVHSIARLPTQTLALPRRVLGWAGTPTPRRRSHTAARHEIQSKPPRHPRRPHYCIRRWTHLRTLLCAAALHKMAQSRQRLEGDGGTTVDGELATVAASLLGGDSWVGRLNWPAWSNLRSALHKARETSEAITGMVAKGEFCTGALCFREKAARLKGQWLPRLLSLPSRAAVVVAANLLQIRDALH